MEPENQYKPVDPSQLKFFVGMCETNKKKSIPKPLSDYNRLITESYEKRKLRSSLSDVPQLGAQKK